jgi:hypothetical protein
MGASSLPFIRYGTTAGGTGSIAIASATPAASTLSARANAFILTNRRYQIMTRKDYELIARTLKAEVENPEHEGLTGPESLQIVCHELANAPAGDSAVKLVCPCCRH